MADKNQIAEQMAEPGQLVGQPVDSERRIMSLTEKGTEIYNTTYATHSEKVLNSL